MPTRADENRSVDDGDRKDRLARAISHLTSLNDGDFGVIETVSCGTEAIPYLREILFAREPSGFYETRRRAIDALLPLRAVNVIADYLALALTREITDPVERTGEDAVINASARALAKADAAQSIPLLMRFTARWPLAGIIDALSQLGCDDALSYFVAALTQDFTRTAAEEALRRLKDKAIPALMEAAIRRRPSSNDESESSKRARLSALALLAELGWKASGWPPLLTLVGDSDPRIAHTACRVALGSGDPRLRSTSVERLIDLLGQANWPLDAEIESTLIAHLDITRDTLIAAMQQNQCDRATVNPQTRLCGALLRVARHFR